MKFLVVPALALALSGCATVVDGAYQDITLTSNAEGATCSIVQNGVEVVPASPVPSTHTIAKNAGNLNVSCAADGYEPATVALMAGKHPMAVTGIALTGALINVGTDALTSSWHEYQDRAYIHLLKAK